MDRPLAMLANRLADENSLVVLSYYMLVLQMCPKCDRPFERAWAWLLC